MLELEEKAAKLNEMEVRGEIKVFDRKEFTNFRCYPPRSFSLPLHYKHSKD